MIRVVVGFANVVQITITTSAHNCAWLSRKHKSSLRNIIIICTGGMNNKESNEKALWILSYCYFIERVKFYPFEHLTKCD